MIVRFFGEPGRQLFGAYHPPEADRARDRAVLLCYPDQQEYRHVHWAFRKLAALLSANGFHALRFDYLGTADSAGDISMASLAQWTSDVRVAATELRELTGLRRISLIGLRLGAVLAARACAAGLAATELVLWEPVIDGQAYLDELKQSQNRFVIGLRYPQDPTRLPDELLGFRLPAALRSSIASIDLTQESVGTPGRVLVVEAAPRAEAERLVREVCSRGVPCSYEVIPDAGMTAVHRSQAETLLVHRILETIVSFLSAPA